MVSNAFKFMTIILVGNAVFYQAVMKDLIWTTLGYGRVLDPIHSFDYRCEKVEGLGLEACEDMWLHEPSGLLYLACSDSLGKAEWNPSVDHLNATGRPMSDRMAIIETRGNGPLKNRLKWISTTDYSGVNGDKTLTLQGFDVQVKEGNPPTLNILLVNNRPPINPGTGALLDAESIGANATIELFETTLGSTTMRHLKTYHHDVINTPNNVAFVGDGSFVFTNDKSSKVGFRRGLDVLLGGGNVGYCSPTECHLALTKPSTYNYPNGLIRGPDGLIYVPSVIKAEIYVLSLESDLTLKQLHTIKVGHPLDNLSKDSKGDIYAASFPQVHKTAGSFMKPLEVNPPSAVWRIRKVQDGEYEVKKILEDDGSVLPGSTVAVHDPAGPGGSDRLYLGGVMSPFITICEGKAAEPVLKVQQ